MDDAVCAYEDWLEAMNKLKYERMNRANRAMKVSHDKQAQGVARGHLGA